MAEAGVLIKGNLSRIRQGKVVGVLDFQYNPSTLRRGGNVEWKMGLGPGGFLPVATFGKMGDLSISLELLFDARETYDSNLEGLRGVLAEAESIGIPAVDRWNSKRNALAVSPDTCMLVLGTRSWHCECVNWSITEEMWNLKLMPVRARVSYTLRLTNPGMAILQKYVDSIKTFRTRYESTFS